MYLKSLTPVGGMIYANLEYFQVIRASLSEREYLDARYNTYHVNISELVCASLEEESGLFQTLKFSMLQTMLSY